MKVKREFKVRLPEALPEPTGYHILVVIPKVETTTAGGIMVPDDTKDQQQHASIIAYVAKLGPDAYEDRDKFPGGAWCSVGDYVLIKSYDGNRLEVDGVEFRILNDDTVLGVAPDPSAIGRVR